MVGLCSCWEKRSIDFLLVCCWIVIFGRFNRLNVWGLLWFVLVVSYFGWILDGNLLLIIINCLVSIISISKLDYLILVWRVFV